MMVKLRCAADGIGELTPGTIKTILDKDRSGDYLLLDVRQPWEYKEGHIPGATFIPLGELEARYNELDRSKKILTYCRTGHRSMAAAITLCQLGFKQVSHMTGGIMEWPYEKIAGMDKRAPDLIAEEATVRDILMLGIKLEKGSYDFYKAAKNKTRSPAIKNVLQILANAEEGHMQRLYRRAIETLGKSSLAPLAKLADEQRTDYMEGGIEINPALADYRAEFKDKREIIETAIEKEYMSYDFYKQAATVIHNANAKILLHELALDERNHADILLRLLAQPLR
jgi:rhodanese-related sulfurtransferase/rubrerythrin